MALLFKTHFKLARTSIKENRTRSFLTCLGIAIGVASIILILSLMGSISNLVKNEVSEIGSDLIVVRPNSTKSSINNIIEELTSSNTFQQSSLSLSDIDTISGLDNVAAVAPISTSVNTLESEKILSLLYQFLVPHQILLKLSHSLSATAHSLRIIIKKTV